MKFCDPCFIQILELIKSKEKEFIKTFHIGYKKLTFLFAMGSGWKGKIFHLAHSSPKCCFKIAKIEDC